MKQSKLFCLLNFLLIGMLVVQHAPGKPVSSEPLLAQTQKAAEADYDFSGYKLPEFMRNIYLGRFDLVTRPPDSHPTPLSILGGGAENKLAMAVVFHNNIYSVKCMAASSEPATPVVKQIVLVRTRGGIEVERTPGKRYEYKIRNRFLNAYNEADAKLGGFQSAMSLLSGSMENTVADLDRFSEQVGCNSRALSQFEENLHRAFNGEQPVQAERSGAEAAPLFFRGCAQVVPQIKPGLAAGPACSCLRNVLLTSVSQEDLWALEDNFTREFFLPLLVSKIGLREKAAGCLR